MTGSAHEFDRYADVRAALADPHLVPPAAESGPVGSMAWLRATVARFSSGETHARRRAVAGRPLGHDIEMLLVETLRHDPPVRAMRRVAVRDTCVVEVDIAEGDLVILDVDAANRDPEVFTDPEAFDPERSGPPPLTFGSPPRVCPGRAHAMAIAAGALSRDPDASITDDPIRPRSS